MYILNKYILIASLLLSLFFINNCATPVLSSKQINNICNIFYENPKWYNYANKTYRKWSVPPAILMAIIHQESKFYAHARPPRTKCLFIFPGPRPSSAFGYAQALTETWDRYIQETGKWGPDRNDFSDSIEFVGWYCNISHQICGISKNDAYNLYLAYHEGQGGFNRKTYKNKTWLKKVAQKVQKRARIYQDQLNRCEIQLNKETDRCCFLPFF